MRLTKLSLTNFRSFSDTQTIEFAPVTLLFGPNSAGKSTVLMALFYLKHILQTGQCDPMRLEDLGDKYVGGFRNLVHGRDLNRSIKLRVSYALIDDVGSSYANFMNLMPDVAPFQINSPAEEFEEASIEIEISWSKSARTAYISLISYFLDGEPVAQLSSDPGMKQPVVSALNYAHQYLTPENQNEWLSEFASQGGPLHTVSVEHLLRNMGGGTRVGSGSETEAAVIKELFKDECDDLEISDDGYVSELHRCLNEDRAPEHSPFISNSGNLFSFVHAPIGFRGIGGALPPLGKALETTLDFDDARVSEFYKELLSDILVAPLDNLFKYLNESLSIGPIREIPDPTYHVNPYPKAKDWHNGLAAWDLLASGDMDLLRAVDDWISSEHKLDLGYSLVVREEMGFSKSKSVKTFKQYGDQEQQWDSVFSLLTKYVSLNKEIGKIYSSGKVSFDKEISKYVSDFSKHIKSDLIMFKNEDKPVFDGSLPRSTYLLRDNASGIEVAATDVGVGVSQLLPVVVAAVKGKSGLVAVEQPELHLHPKVQVSIGDLLTQIKTKKNFLIETHSEHLILRILKRIRQTADSELPAGFKVVSPSNVSIVYLDPTESGVKAKKITVDSDGDFVERWPRGFFAERREELM